MKDIPVIIKWDGKEVEGILSAPHGCGTYGFTWFLLIRNFYKGQLGFDSRTGWQFSTQKGYFKEWAKYFGEIVEGEHPELDFSIQPGITKN